MYKYTHTQADPPQSHKLLPCDYDGPLVSYLAGILENEGSISCICTFSFAFSILKQIQKCRIGTLCSNDFKNKVCLMS
jgi:hypothetical protein